MKPHKLIDREKPECLFCKSDVNLHISSVGYPAYTVDSLTCRNKKCKTIFEIHAYEDSDYEDNVVAFTFTCKDLCIRNNYATGAAVGTVLIGAHDLLYSKRGISAPYIELGIDSLSFDFSNKKKLYKKLKTYVVFS